MRVALVTVFSQSECTLKDVAGGFGTVFRIGDSRRARLLESAKRRVARLPPVVLAYLAAEARRAGHTASVVDVDARGGVPDDLPRVDQAIVLTSIVDTEAEAAVLRAFRARGVHTVAVGAMASAVPAHYADVADAVVLGEPEALGARLFDTGLAGVVEAGFVADLDALPHPDWSPFDVASFRYAFLSHFGVTLPVSGARGCTFGCGYCPWRVTAPFRERTPASIEREVRELVARYGARAIAFRDPLFNLDRERTREIAARLRPLRVRWSAEMRADRLDEPLLRELAAGGLRSLEMGVESVDREMLKRERRAPPAFDEIERVARVADGLGIRVIANFMFGLPDDDEARIRASVAYAKRLAPFAVQFTVATPYPGTTLAARVGARLPVLGSGPAGAAEGAGAEILARGSGRSGVRGATPTGWDLTFEHPRLSRETIADLREWAYVSFHYRPGYVASFARRAVRSLIEEAGMSLRDAPRRLRPEGSPLRSRLHPRRPRDHWRSD